MGCVQRLEFVDVAASILVHKRALHVPLAALSRLIASLTDLRVANCLTLHERKFDGAFTYDCISQYSINQVKEEVGTLGSRSLE